MASDPQRFVEFLNRQRQLAPSQDVTLRVERNVMSRLAAPKSARYPRRLAVAFGLLAALAVTVIILAVHRGPGPAASTPPAFVESVVILEDGHVCIWLEPVDPPTRKPVQ